MDAGDLQEAGGDRSVLPRTRSESRARLQSEQANELERQRFAAILKTACDGIHIVNPDGLLVDANDAFLNMLGYDRAVIGQRKVADWEAQKSQQDIAATIQHLLGQSSPLLFETRFRHSDGHVFTVEINARAFKLGGQDFLYASARDITERKRAESLLRKLSLAVEQSPESIVITNLDGEIEYVNDAFVRITGYQHEELLGKNPRILQSGKTPRKTYAAMWDALGQGRIWKGELINRRKDGTEYVELATITPLRQPDGTISHYVAVKEDITKKKRLGLELDGYRHHLEELVAQRTTELVVAQNQAETANRAKSAFLANMSHEIRTPMNAIIGLTHLLRSAGMTREQEARLAGIDSAGRHLLSVINDILDISKIEAGRLQLESVDFSLACLLDNVVSIAGNAVQEKKLRIEVERDGVPPWLNGDPTRLRQALLNYAGNAVKFTESGVITLRTRLLEDNGEEVLVRFEVVDSGVGIAVDRMPRLFQSFEQADTSTSRKYGGTGLGLAITLRLAQMMGGEVGADSTAGLGSTFWFTARLRHGQGPVSAAPTPAVITDAEVQLRQNCHGARLLLAEDNAVNREITLELLGRVGLVLDTAKDGRSAVDKAGAASYDLILMDVQMPVMDGLDATRELRATAAWHDKPILAMTANAFDEDRTACLAAGMNDFVAKPVAPNDLYATLLKWLPCKGITTPVTIPSPEPESSCNEVLIARLASLPGVEPEQAMRTLGVGTSKYLRLMQLFVEKHRDDSAKLAERLQRQDFADAHSIVHTLKGVAGSLRLQKLYETTATLDKQLLEPELNAALVRQPVEEIGQQLRQLFDTLATAPHLPVAATASEPANPAQVAALMYEMTWLLMHSDTRALTMLQENEPLLRSVLGPHYEQFEQMILVFDFDAALTQLPPSIRTALVR